MSPSPPYFLFEDEISNCIEDTQLTRLTFLTVVVLKSSDQTLEQTFMVPFERDPKFVGRIDIITDLDHKLSSQRRVALAGIGGVG